MTRVTRRGDPSVAYAKGNKVHVTLDGRFTLCGGYVRTPAILTDVLLGEVCVICSTRFREEVSTHAAHPFGPPWRGVRDDPEGGDR
jgi:hypothetical protein